MLDDLLPILTTLLGGVITGVGFLLRDWLKNRKKAKVAQVTDIAAVQIEEIRDRKEFVPWMADFFREQIAKLEKQIEEGENTVKLELAAHKARISELEAAVETLQKQKKNAEEENQRMIKLSIKQQERIQALERKLKEHGIGND